MSQPEQKYAIRFGLGAIKAVGLGMMEIAIKERRAAGKFKDIYDFSSRLDPKSINKKSIEALAKSGSFEDIAKNRRQIFESFDILSAFSIEKKEEATSSQMSMFGALLGDKNSKPELKKVEDWTKVERLQREFEAFGYFLNEHPVDDHIEGLRRRGIVFSDKIERDELEDNNLIKMAGVIASSKHRSSARGRFAYVSISDPFGIYEAMIFDEAIITNARDILVDGSAVMIECLIKKDEGGIRILVRDVQKLDDFLKNVPAQKEAFEDIKKQKQRIKREGDGASGGSGGGFGGGGAKREWSKDNKFGGGAPKSDQPSDAYKQRVEKLEAKQIFAEVTIVIKERDAIFRAKAALSQMVAPASFAKKTKVIFEVELDGKKAVIELPLIHLLDEADVSRLRAIDKIVEVKTA